MKNIIYVYNAGSETVQIVISYHNSKLLMKVFKSYGLNYYLN